MDERTLTERVRRLEDILVETGIAGDRNEAQEPVRKFVNEDFPGREDIGIDLSDRAGFSARGAGVLGFVGGEDYRGAQDTINRRMSKHVERDVWASAQVEQERDRSSLDEILTQLGCISEHGEVIAGRLEDLGNRAFGHMPEEDREKTNLASTPDPLIDRLFIACNRLSVLMGRFETAQVRACRIA